MQAKKPEKTMSNSRGRERVGARGGGGGQRQCEDVCAAWIPKVRGRVEVDERVDGRGARRRGKAEAGTQSVPHWRSSISTSSLMMTSWPVMWWSSRPW